MVPWTYTTVMADARYPLDTVPNHESAELRWVAEDDVADMPLHPGLAASWHQLRTAVARVSLAPGDERLRHLPRTVELESGVFLWCVAANADSEPSPLSSRITSLLSEAPS